MAKKIIDLPNYNAPTTDNPDGSLKSEVVVNGQTVEVGSPVSAPYHQDLLNPFHKLVRRMGQTLSGSADTQSNSQFFNGLITELIKKALVGELYASSGSVNAYVLTHVEQLYPTLTQGMQFRFKSLGDSTNTVVTVTINGQTYGLSDTFLANGGTPSVQIGAIKANEYIQITFEKTPDELTSYFKLTTVPLTLLSEGQASINVTQSGTKKTLELSKDTVLVRSYDDDNNQAYTELGDYDIRQRWFDVIGPDANRYFHDSSAVEWSVKTYRSGVLLHAVGAASEGVFYEGFAGDDISGIKWRTVQYSIPANITFIATGDGEWLAVDGPFAYTLITTIPTACIIGGCFAYYRRADGKYAHAPARLVDNDKSESNYYFNEIAVLSGDSSNGVTWMPDPTKFVKLLITVGVP